MSKVVITNPEENRCYFPAAYELISMSGAGLVVLFFGETRGVVICPGETLYSLGEQKNGWHPCFNKTDWKPVNVSIEH